MYINICVFHLLVISFIPQTRCCRLFRAYGGHMAQGSTPLHLYLFLSLDFFILLLVFLLVLFGVQAIPCKLTMLPTCALFLSTYYLCIFLSLSLSFV